MFTVNYKIEKPTLSCFITAVAKIRVCNFIIHDTMENEKV